MSRPARGAASRGVLFGLAFLVLLGMVLFLASERNARLWFLVLEDGQLQVKRGIMAPVGRSSFKTDDARLLAAYAPVKPPPGAQPAAEQTFDDRAGLDQALYDLLARWARDDVGAERPDQLERATGYVARAEQLAGLSAAQREDLRALRAETGYFEARQLLERGQDALRQARERLRGSAQSTSAHAGESAEALKSLEPVLEELHKTARLLAPPRREAPPPPPAPAGAEGK